MSRTKHFAFNSISSAILQVITLAVGLILPRYIILNYGSSINGLIISITQFVVYFKLVESGVSSATSYALYEPIARKDTENINIIVSTAKSFYVKAALLFLILVVSLSVLYPQIVQIKGLSNVTLGLLVLIIGLKGPLEFYTLSRFRPFLSAAQKTYIISATTVLHLVINTSIIIFLSELGYPLILVYLISLLSTIVRSWLLKLYIKKNYPFIKYDVKIDYSKLDKRWDALYIQILNTVISASPIVIATLILNDLKEISVMSVYIFVASGLSGVLGIFKSGLSASFGDIIAKKESDILLKSYKLFEYSYYMILAIFISTMFILFESFIRIYTSGISDISYLNYGLLYTSTALCLFENIMTPQRMLINSAGIYKEMRKSITIEIVMAITFSVLFGVLFGSTGILLAIVISHSYRAIYLGYYIPKKIIKTSYRSTYLRMLLTILVTVITIIVSSNIMSFHSSDYLQWFIKAIVGFGINSFIVITMFAILDFKSVNDIRLKIIKIIRK